MNDLFKKGRIIGISKKSKQIHRELRKSPMARKLIIKPEKEELFIEGLEKYGGKTITRKEMSKYLKKIAQSKKGPFCEPFGKRESRAIRRTLLNRPINKRVNNSSKSNNTKS